MSAQILSVSLGSNSSGDSIAFDKCEGLPGSPPDTNIKLYKSRDKRQRKKRPRPDSIEKMSYKQESLYVGAVFEGWTERQKVRMLSNLIEQIQSPEAKYDLLTRLENALKFDPTECLPPELNLCIMGYLDRKDLGRAAQVSVRWKCLAYDKSLVLHRIQEGSFYCLNCEMFLGRESDILHRKFRLDYSLAYNVKTLCNVKLGEPQRVSYSTGQYTVAHASCKQCTTALGVKYVIPSFSTSDIKLECHSEENRNRQNTFLVKRKGLYFPGEPAQISSLVCRGCSEVVGKEQDIIDWNYMIRGGEAYLVSRMVNITLGEPTPVSYTTGNYTVVETFCKTCEENLGVKYLEAPSGKNAFKIGAYLIEKPKTKVVSKPLRPREDPIDEKKKQRTLFGSLFSFLRKKE